MYSSPRSRVVVAITGLVFIASAYAQSNRGAIVGTVTDPHSAAVAGASVMVVDAGTGQTWRQKTSALGGFQFPEMNPVVYRVTVEAAGFETELVEGVKVDTSNTTSIDVHLKVGNSKQTVTITAEAPLISTQETAAGSTITQKQIEDLPIADRSVLSLALTLPNVGGVNQTDNVGVFQNTLAPGQGLNINGSRPGEATFLADGVSNTGIGFSRAVVTFSPDTVQEFTVQTSNFSAEYGSTGGGFVSFTTKSGTNDIHGSGTWFVRNPFFNATPYSDSSVRPASQLRENDATVTVGGPVWIPKIYKGRNKTFFFAAWEPRWRSDGQSNTTITAPANWSKGDMSDMVSANGAYLPISAARQLGLSYTPVTIYNQFNVVNGNQFQQVTLASGQTYTPFPNNTIPQSMLDPTSQKIIQRGMPPAGDWFLNGSTPQNYQYIRGVQTNNKPLTVRIDHHATDTDSIYGRFTTVPNFGVRSRGFFSGSDVNQFQTDYSQSKQLLVGETHIFSPSVVNDLKLNYLRGNYNTTNSPYWQDNNWSTELGLPSLTKGGLPQFNFSSQGLFTIGQNSVVNIGQRIEDTYNVTDSLTWTHSRMTTKFGIDMRRALAKMEADAYATGGVYRFQAGQTNSSSSGGTGGSDYASFLLGVPSGVTLQSSTIPYYYRWNALNGYVQNHWQLLKNLTVDFGLRYSLDLPRTEKYGLQATLRTDLSATVPVGTILNTNGTPYTGLPANLLPSSAKVPVLQFAGRGGASEYLYPPDYLELQPRFGFAYVPHFFGFNNGPRTMVIRGGYGLSYLPVTGTDISPSPNFSLSSQTYGLNSGQANPNYLMRLSSNPPVLSTGTSVAIPANGLVPLNSLSYSGTFAVAQDFKVPYSQTFSLAIQMEVLRDTVVEVGYSGSKGTHLFFPALNVNPLPFSVSQQLSALNVSLTSTVRDPLNRPVDPNNSNSSIINVPIASLLQPYLGFTSLLQKYETGADSTHHAVYVTANRRLSRGLSFRTTYTFQKTLTDASETGVCTPCGSGSRIWTQISLGATHQQEKSVASFNQPQVWTSTATYDLPFGRGRSVWSNAPRVFDQVINNWRVSGIGTIQSGTPMVVALFDTNGLSALTQGSNNAVVRADIVPGVPQKNPLWDPSCSYGSACAPYANPAAFQRPALGQLGNAPSTLPQLYTPLQKNFDMSVVKNIYFGESRRRYIQIKADAINVLNTRGYAMSSGNSFNGAWIQKAPSFTGDISSANFTAWANAWTASHPGDSVSSVANTATNPVYAQVVNLTALPRAANGGVLPNNFYSVPLPQNFGFLPANNFDIRTLQGLKNYNLSTAGYNTSWGTLSYFNNARFMQFALKLVF